MSRRIPLSKEFTVNTNPGLDIRPAAMIVQTLLPVRSTVVAEANEERVDGKSVLELCCLHAARGTRIKFTATGAEATRALHAVQHLFATQFQAPRPPDAQPGVGGMGEDGVPFSHDYLPLAADLQFSRGERY